MPLYLMQGLDKVDALAVRMDTRPAHLEWIGALGSRLKLAGPMHAEDGGPPIGSVIIIEAETLDAAKTTFAKDPYASAGLWAELTIRPFTWVKP